VTIRTIAARTMMRVRCGRANMVVVVVVVVAGSGERAFRAVTVDDDDVNQAGRESASRGETGWR
jgi:hypothetical protein